MKIKVNTQTLSKKFRENSADTQISSLKIYAKAPRNTETFRNADDRKQDLTKYAQYFYLGENF